MTDISRRDAMVSAAAISALALASSASAADTTPLAAWDLTELYPNDAAWEAERATVAARLPAIAAYKGRMGEGAGALKSVLQLQSDPREYFESGIAWNVSKHVGLEVKYKHGSLPPMFEFLDHQVSVGVTFKTKLPAHL